MNISREKILQFQEREDIAQDLNKAWENHSDFLKKFPFREKPDSIDELTKEKLWKTGSKDSFFYWLQYPLGWLGRYTVWGQWLDSACEQIDFFKKLIRQVVDDSKSLSEKVDLPWETIRGFGGDKHIAKKIISVYYPQEVIPIFKTEHLEYFAEQFGINFEKAHEEYNKGYSDLSCGEKWELFNNILLQEKEKMNEMKDWDNALFVRFLYEGYSPPKPMEVKAGLLGKVGMLFEPANEMGVICLFSMHHRELGFPYILKIRTAYPDAIVIDEDGEPQKIEFEYVASNFKQHGHDPEKCDYIICWKNDIPDVELGPKVIELKGLIAQLVNA